MSTAIAAEPCAAPESARPPAEFVTMAQATRLSGLHETTILRLALSRDVGFKTRGRRTLFNTADVLRAAG